MSEPYRVLCHIGPILTADCGLGFRDFISRIGVLDRSFHGGGIVFLISIVFFGGCFSGGRRSPFSEGSPIFEKSGSIFEKHLKVF